MMMDLNARSALAVAGCVLMILALGACGAARKEYIPPQTSAGQSCVSQCSVEKTQCVAEARDRQQVCKDRYDYEMRNYNWCVRSGQQYCHRPTRCPPPDTRGCSARYDVCFQSCGGQIEEGGDDDADTGRRG